MTNYEMVNTDELKVAPYKATYILRPDLLVLAASLEDFGFIIPIIVHRSTMEVIDGNERLLLAKSQKTIIAKCEGFVPVVFVDCDKYEAMLMHLRINRGRSSIVAKPMSTVIRELIFSGKSNRESLNRQLAMKKDEFDLMLDGNLLKNRKISEHKYSRAWVPVEAPPGTLASMPPMESPPNQDR
jgi:ParB-like chromosome segregation protein Spo0J